MELDALTPRFDWVLNARRSLLRVKLEKPLAEFKELIEKVRTESGSDRVPGTQR